MKDLIDFYPYKINKILTDNGKEWTDRFIRGKKEASGRHEFDKECKLREIEHRLTLPYTPKTNGMVERFNGRIAEILRKNKFENYEKLSDALNYYMKCYNHYNKQKALDYKSPVDMIKYWFEKKKEIFKENINMSCYNLLQPNNILFLQKKMIMCEAIIIKISNDINGE